ncbi:MAG: exodeoxyribonuclease VII large subunit [Acidimicrobiales bacterium]
MTVQTWSVSEVCQGITDLFEQTFGEEIWVRGEVQGYRTSPQGHAYFDLLEPTKAKRGSTPKIPVTLFAGRRRGVDATLRKVGDLTLDDGLEVRIRGDLRYYAPQSRVQLLMTAIDPRHTLGQMAAEKERLLRALSEEGLLRRNAEQDLTAVPLNVAIVTSVDSAAYNDVIEELRSSGIGFKVTVADARVQGKRAEASIVAALATLAARDPDVILLIRGGGSRSDLAAFESELVARTIASLRVPVITGIGHEIDRSIADEVAHTALKTPTAVAGFLNDRTRSFLAAVETSYAAVARNASHQLGRHSTHLSHQGSRIRGLTSATFQIETNNLVARRTLLAQRVSAVLTRNGRLLDDHDRTLRTSAPRLIGRSSRQLEQIALLIAQLHPNRMLQRGFSITRTEKGDLVRSVANVSPGTIITTQLAMGRVISEISRIQEPTDDR